MLIQALPANLPEFGGGGAATAFLTLYTCKRFIVVENGKADTDCGDFAPALDAGARARPARRATPGLPAPLAEGKRHAWKRHHA